MKKLTNSPDLRPIDGKHNALLKELRRAFADGDLTLDGYCAVEGMKIIEEAIRSGLKFRAVFFRESAKNKADRLLPQLAAHVEKLLLPDKIFASAVPSETPQGVAALVKCKTFSVADVIAKSKGGPLVAIAGVQDPGNLGTILRSAEAFGAGGVLLGEGHGERLQFQSDSGFGWLGLPSSVGESEAGRNPSSHESARAASGRYVLTQKQIAR